MKVRGNSAMKIARLLTSSRVGHPDYDDPQAVTGATLSAALWSSRTRVAP
jgi:hypothetical protein